MVHEQLDPPPPPKPYLIALSGHGHDMVLMQLKISKDSTLQRNNDLNEIINS